MFFAGMFLIIIGMYSIFEDIIDFNLLIKDREIKRRSDFIIDPFYELKAAAGLFSIIVGIFTLINYFYM